MTFVQKIKNVFKYGNSFGIHKGQWYKRITDQRIYRVKKYTTLFHVPTVIGKGINKEGEPVDLVFGSSVDTLIEGREAQELEKAYQGYFKKKDEDEKKALEEGFDKFKRMEF